MTTPIDPRIVAYATPPEREVCALIAAHPEITQAEIGQRLGISGNAVYQRLHNMRRRAARAGIAPASDMTVAVPPGYHVRGHSTMYRVDTDPDTGEPVRSVAALQWVKTQVDHESSEAAMRIAAEEMCAGIRTAALDPIAPPSGACDPATLAVYPVGDHHLGMLAWRDETGESYDLDIAERTLAHAIDQLVLLAPPTDEALLLLIGDFFHADSRTGRTETSGNALDVDGRYARVIRVAVRSISRAIDRLLERHQSTRVIAVGGNHDYHSSLWLAITLDALYSREPRVSVDTSPAARRYHVHGRSLIGAAHGHTSKPAALPGIMAHERPSDWGHALHRHWYTGHRHAQTTYSYPGCSVEVLPVLPPGDAWHVEQGYVGAARAMRLDLWDREHGRVCSHSVGIRQIHQVRHDQIA